MTDQAPELLLNLSAWIERRAKEVGPYADHIIHSVKHYEAEIERLRSDLANPLFVNDGKCEERWIEDTENACPCCGGSGHKDDCRADLAAPKVKPLVWSDGTHVATSHAGFVEYRILRTQNKDIENYMVTRSDGKTIGYRVGRPEAKAAAQDDHNEYILSALEGGDQ